MLSRPYCPEEYISGRVLSSHCIDTVTTLAAPLRYISTSSCTSPSGWTTKYPACASFPALTASAAVTLAVANLAQPAGIAAAAMLRALGATGMFLGDRLMAANALGGIRLKYESVWEWLLLCGGLTLMTVGAWLTAAPM